MRSKWPAILFLVLCLGFGWHALGYLDAPRADIWATPTPQPDQAAPLVPVKVPPGRTVCVDNVPFGPEARYVWVTPLPGGVTKRPIDVVARAPGYVAKAQIPAGTFDNQPAYVRLRPTARTERSGSLCLTPNERHAVSFYGVPSLGRIQSRSVTTIDDVQAPATLSVTVLTGISSPINSRLDTLTARIAAFRPGGTWLIWILGLLVVFGAPAAIACALGRAIDDDESPQSSDRK